MVFENRYYLDKITAVGQPAHPFLYNPINSTTSLLLRLISGHRSYFHYHQLLPHSVEPLGPVNSDVPFRASR